MSRCAIICLIAAAVPVFAACTPTTNLDARPAPVSYASPDGRVRTTQGSAVAITGDERIAVVCNRADGIVSVLRLDLAPELAVDPETAVHLRFAPLQTSKPWAVVIGPDNDTAYVLLRGPEEGARDARGRVVRISGLHSEPRESGQVGVGYEPTSIVISPNGTRLYVANWGDGSVTPIVTDGLIAGRWDLNYRLAKSGLLGARVGLPFEADWLLATWAPEEFESSRPALAHPRALAITDNGDADDADETLYATEFFSQPGGDATLIDPDRNRQGLVYPIALDKPAGAGHAPLDAEGGEVNLISLEPVDDTGFPDAEGNVTGCVPSQLYSAAITNDRLYVTSVCASAAGPTEKGPAGAEQNNFKTLLHPVVFTVDVTPLEGRGVRQNRQLPGESLVLTRELERLFDADGADPTQRRMPLIPNEIVLSSSSEPRAYVSAFGAGALFSVALGTPGQVEMGTPGRRFYDLTRASLPIGSAILSKGRALVLEQNIPMLYGIELESGISTPLYNFREWLDGSDIPAEQRLSREVREGRRLFATGLQGWSLNGQAWSSCESCHPEGLSDGVTWRFSRGPRRTLSLAGTYQADSKVPRVLLWGANIDEIHDLEAIARGLSGGVGGFVWNPYAGSSAPSADCRLLYDGAAPSEGTNLPCPGQMRTSARAAGLTGALSALPVASSFADSCADSDASKSTRVCDQDGTSDWNDIDAFIRSVRAPAAPLAYLNPELVAQGRATFQRSCATCHGGPGWTLSRRFYTPGEEANGALPYAKPTVDEADLPRMLGLLRSTSYVVPPAAPDEAVRRMPFRSSPADGASAQDVVDWLYSSPPPLDQITCVMRSVGTFPAQDPEGEPLLIGVGAPASPVREVRRVLNAMTQQYEDKLAQGATGFNIPSLLGMSVGAPYFHAGNARSLEEMFDSVFERHSGGVDVRAMVSFLLSIDEDTDLVPVPAAGTGDVQYEPDLCKSYPGHIAD